MSSPNAARAAELARRTPRSAASTISGSGSRSTTVPSARRSCSISAVRAAAAAGQPLELAAETAACPAAPATRGCMQVRRRRSAARCRPAGPDRATRDKRQHSADDSRRRANRQPARPRSRPIPSTARTIRRPRGPGASHGDHQAACGRQGGVRMTTSRSRALVAGAHAALDGGGDQRVEMQFGHGRSSSISSVRWLAQLARGDDLAGQRVGGLAQPRLQCAAHQPRGMLQPVLLVQQPHRGVGDGASCSVVKSWNTGSVCTWPDITPISRSVMPPSAAATRTMVQNQCLRRVQGFARAHCRTPCLLDGEPDRSAWTVQAGERARPGTHASV